MILNKLEDFTNAILEGEEIKHKTLFYTGEYDDAFPMLKLGDGYKINGHIKGIVAAELNWDLLILSLQDEPKKLTFGEAAAINKNGWRCPTKTEWLAISDNFEEINKALKRAGGEPLQNRFYWSASELSNNNNAWVVHPSDGAMYSFNYKNYSRPVRCVLAL